jgi:hypothetical protein
MKGIIHMKSKKSTLILDKSERLSKSPDLWDKAIADAQELIGEAETEIAKLRRSIKLLADLKRSGAQFPGEASQ